MAALKNQHEAGKNSMHNDHTDYIFVMTGAEEDDYDFNVPFTATNVYEQGVNSSYDIMKL